MWLVSRHVPFPPIPRSESVPSRCKSSQTFKKRYAVVGECLWPIQSLTLRPTEPAGRRIWSLWCWDQEPPRTMVIILWSTNLSFIGPATAWSFPRGAKPFKHLLRSCMRATDVSRHETKWQKKIDRHQATTGWMNNCAEKIISPEWRHCADQ